MTRSLGITVHVKNLGWETCPDSFLRTENPFSGIYKDEKYVKKLRVIIRNVQYKYKDVHCYGIESVLKWLDLVDSTASYERNFLFRNTAVQSSDPVDLKVNLTKLADLQTNIYMDSIQKRLNNLMTFCLTPWSGKKVNKGMCNEMNNIYQKEFMILKIIFLNGKLYPDQPRNIHHFSYKGKQFWYDIRRKAMLKLIYSTLEYLKKQELKIPDTTVFLNLDDNYMWRYPKLPFFVFAKPKNQNGIIFPDPSFMHEAYWNQRENKLCFKVVNWEKQKTLFKEQCQSIKKKESLIFFQGSSTTDVRTTIARTKFHVPVQINIDQNFICPRNYRNFKYLLDLPGYRPWSYRLRQLYLSKSLVICVLQKTYGGCYAEDNWITFFNYIFTPNKDYVPIELDYYVGDIFRNTQNMTAVVWKIEKTYQHFENNFEEYQETVERSYRKVNRLSLTHVYQYIYKLLIQYSKIF